MSLVPIWFERKFEFSLPAEFLPNLCTRLRGTPPRMEEILNARAQQVLIERPQGKWSAQEHAGHLLELEALWLARVEDYAAGSAQLTAADLQNRSTDDADYNARPLQDVLEKFRAARDKLLHRLGGVDASLFTRTIPHPRLKIPMRLIDHLYFVAEHDDHHLARMWEILHEPRL